MPGWAGGGVSCGPSAQVPQASVMFLDGWEALLAGVWGEAGLMRAWSKHINTDLDIMV